jgi:CRISPR/Cas system-associated endonuclease Cas3-HD
MKNNINLEELVNDSMKKESTQEMEKTFMQLPEVQAGKNVWQNDFHQYDVFGHTMSYVKHVKKLTKDKNIIAAGYLHDIGKPVVATKKYKNGILQERSPSKPYHKFDNHENVGGDMVKRIDPKIFERFELNQEKIADLVACHYLPMKGIKNIRKATIYTDFLERLEELNKTLESQKVSKKEVLTMFLADKLAQGKYCTDREELFAVRDILLRKGDKKKVYQMMQKVYH